MKNKYLNVLITMLNKRIQPEKYQNMKAEFFLNSMGFGVKITTLKVLCEQAIVFEKNNVRFPIVTTENFLKTVLQVFIEWCDFIKLEKYKEEIL